ncbi:polypeptide-transport-associated domain-containing protein FtsQ-type [Tolypothrix sp. NIES-4075]|uniref:cell division protein FtsQ/DivIB n=1 Tax=Tolypothrix sp. NIES-4075 TaxID=2005459 RepID=UPI000B5C7DEE|nr:FtsQ-type POTRA domain-containing protein [Tolypothrix sp. NIES-4075]GAX39391.1 polypeptide-transport-associated domain-containing protein FtsQ-type [Tolypothrix sp. NIES-4075]
MAGMVSVSRTDLRYRRQKLRRQRQMKIIQAIWQTFAVSSLLGGLLWVASQPMWVLSAPKQIEIEDGSRSLSPEAISSLLVLSYPQSLWRIEPSRVADSLTKQPTIAKASVKRRLFPPGLIIDIQERVPVAIAQRHHQAITLHTNIASSTGLLDANGIWMPLKKYTSLNPTVKLPSLIVIGSFEQYRPYWNQLYQSVSQSSVQVMEIDCQDPTNIILKTELGYVHLGAVSPQISEQIKVLAQMSHLPTQLNPNQIEYIDLKNPESPLVQMNQKTLKSNSQTR